MDLNNFVHVACNYHYLGWVQLSHKQDTILKIGDFSTKNYDFPPKLLLQILPCKNPSKIMIITSHMQKIIQIHPGYAIWCLAPLSTIFNLYHGGQFYLLNETTKVPGQLIKKILVRLILLVVRKN
jgi:hypothetical protein